MERRQIFFMVFVAAVLATWFGLQQMYGPKPKPKPVAKLNKPADQGVGKEVDNQLGKEGDKPSADGNQPGAKQPEGDADATPKPNASPETWISAGSLNPASPYRFLAAFSTRGAALERVELSNPKFKAVDDLEGYLGEMRLTTDGVSGNLTINVVGDGSPASVAKPVSGATKPGLAPADVLTHVDGKTISEIVAQHQIVLDKKYRPMKKLAIPDPEEAVRWYLAKFKPGAEVPVSVLRGGAPAVFSATLTSRPLSIIGRERFNELSAFDPTSFHLHLATLNGKTADKNGKLGGIPDLSKVNWTPEVKESPEGTVVEFRYELTDAETKAGDLEIIKRYVVPKGEASEKISTLDRSYHLGFTIEIVNKSDKPIKTAYKLEGPTGLPIEGWWYTTKTHPKMFYAAGARDVVFDLRATGHRLIGCSEIVGNSQAAAADGTGETPDRTPIISASATPTEREASYFGVDSLYFASVLIPKGLGTEAVAKSPPRYPVASGGALTVSDLTQIPAKTWNRKGNVTFEVTSDLNTIAAGKTWTSEYEIFVGPKTPELLEKYGIPRVLELGWFAMIARVLSAFLHFIHSIIPSYAIAILLLTVTVRCCVLPFSLKAAKGAAVMQSLAPEMQKIKEKHKDDPAQQGVAMKELWRKHNYNPLSGCLPVFLQIPIFVALYKCLSTDIELRGTPLIAGVDWARNLAGPDMLWFWQPYIWDYFGSEVGWLGPYFNVFPLITIALFLWQQILFTPPATNDEMKQQQFIMKFMTLFMGVMFFKVPAGLCIYFITSSLWGICERLLLFPKPVAAPAGASSSKDGEDLPGIKETRVKRK